MNRRRILKYIAGSAILPITETAYGGVEREVKDVQGSMRVIPFDLDISNIQESEFIQIPTTRSLLFVVKRTEGEVLNLRKSEYSAELKDTNSEQSEQPMLAKNFTRSIRPELFICWGHCTRLGCTIEYASKVELLRKKRAYIDIAGFNCPCDGSAYDLAGRVFSGMPAPTNLIVPEYEFIDDVTIRIHG